MLSKETLALFEKSQGTLAAFSDDKEMKNRDKDAAILAEVRETLTKAGKVFIVGGVPVFVNPEGGVTQMLPGTADYDELLIAFGFFPANSNFDVQLMRFLLASRFPKAEPIGISRYLLDENVLLLNEWDGTFVRIAADGCGRHINGTDGFLFEQGEAAHLTNLEVVNNYRGPALAWDESSLIVQHVFGVGIYSRESGIGREVAMDVLFAWALAGCLPERVVSQPLLHLHGLGGTRKTAVAKAFGWMVSAAGLSFGVVACPEDRKELETTLICARGLVCLDEANNLRTLYSMLKAIVTNAVLERRILYTTANVQRFLIKLLCILTTNNIELSDETVASRVLKLDMGHPVSDGAAYRGDSAVSQEWRSENLRELCWQELVCRLSAAIRLLGKARREGTENPTVDDRMSGFWSFVTAVAQQEGPETLSRMRAASRAVKADQSRSVNSADDILPLLTRWLTDNTEMQGRDLTAGQIASGLLSYPNVSASLTKLIGSAMMLSNKLTASSQYVALLGLKTVNGKRVKMFSFRLPKDSDPPPSDGQYRVNVSLGRLREVGVLKTAKAMNDEKPSKPVRLRGALRRRYL